MLYKDINVKISKLNENAVIPEYMTIGAAAFDLTAVSKENKGDYIEYGFGFAVELPIGYKLCIWPRSGITKSGLIQSNAIGIVDSDYRGEVKVRFYRSRAQVPEYEVGDRVAQGTIEEVIRANFIETPYSELSKTERGTGGFGHTGGH